MAARNTAQDFRDGRQHQKKSAQAQADGFDVSGDARRTQNASNPITRKQEQDCHDPDGMTDRLMCNEEYRCGTDKHGNEIDGAQRRAGNDSAMPGEHVEGYGNGRQAAERMEPAKRRNSEHGDYLSHLKEQVERAGCRRKLCHASSIYSLLGIKVVLPPSMQSSNFKRRCAPAGGGLLRQPLWRDRQRTRLPSLP